MEINRKSSGIDENLSLLDQLVSWRDPRRQYIVSIIYDVQNRRGVIELVEDGDEPEFAGVIKLFKTIDPSVESIQIGDRLYRPLLDGFWECLIISGVQA